MVFGIQSCKIHGVWYPYETTVVWLINMCQSETCNRIWVGKHMSNMFCIKNGLKQGESLSPMCLNFALEYSIRKVLANQEGLNEWYTPAAGLCR
jgi:hypothetical protein